MAGILVLRQLDGGILTLTLNRSEKRNALNRELLGALRDAVDAAMIEADVRVVILIGAGTAFCAGLDLDELRAADDLEEAGESASRVLHDVMHAITRGPKPVIAAVNGPAVAGGAALVSVCDLVIAADTATIGFPGIRRGIVAGVAMPPLIRQLGERLARRLMLTGEVVDAKTALRMGLFDDVVPAAGLGDATRRWASQLAKRPAGAMAGIKAALVECRDAAAGEMKIASEPPAFRFFPPEKP